jgi:hypothetical protein
MTTNTFVLSEIHELLALQRVIMEARYCEIASDTAISASPMVADIHRRVLDAIIVADLPAGLSPENWRKWLVMDEGRREWEIALKRAGQHYSWKTLSRDEKRSFASDLLAPFEVSDELLNKFLIRADDIALL